SSRVVVRVGGGGDRGACWSGWSPEGAVYSSYQLGGGVRGGIGAVTPPVFITGNQFYAGAVADIDADGAQNSWGVNVPDSAGGFTAPPGWTNTNLCAASTPGIAGAPGAGGPLDLGTGLGVLGQVGPCNSVDTGRNVF